MKTSLKYTTLIIILLIFVSMTAPISATTVKATPNDYNIQTVQNSQILITSNADFTFAGFSGNGSLINPFVLKDLSIDTGGLSGISISNTNAFFRIESVIVNNSINPSQAGISLSNVTNGVITNNILLNNYFGILLSQCNDTNISYNNISGSLDHSIMLSGSHNDTVIDNQIWNTAKGIGISALSKHNVVSFNNITDSPGDAIFISESQYNNVTNNYVAYCRMGILIANSSNYNSLKQNTAELNNESGFHILSNYTILTANFARRNSGDGYWINSSHSLFIENYAESNHIDGFKLIDGIHNNFKENQATNNIYGFYLDSNNNSITGNIASSNIKSGFISLSTFNELANNTANSNRIYGIYIFKTSYNTVFNNSVNLNDRGIYVKFSQNIEVIENIIIGNEYYGIQLHDSQSSIITGNLVMFNTIDKEEWVGNGLRKARQGFDNYNLEEKSNTFKNNWNGNYWSDYELRYNIYLISGGYPVYAGSGRNYHVHQEFHYDHEPLGSEAISDLISWSDLSIDRSISSEVILEAGDLESYSISWQPLTNLIPTTYSILINHEIVETGEWEVDQNIIWNELNMIDLRTTNYTLVVSDFSGNSISDSVFLIVRDTTAPEIQYSGPSQITIEEGSLGNSFSASVSDLYASSYTLYQDALVVGSWEWHVGTIADMGVPIDISVNLDYFSAGYYNFTIVALDSSNNQATLDISVHVAGITSSSKDDSDDGFLSYSTNLFLVSFLTIVILIRHKKKTTNHH